MTSLKKNILIFFILVIIIIIIYFIINENKEKNNEQDYYNLPLINLSQQPNYLSNNLLSKILNLPQKDSDQNMVIGLYQRYPLNKSKQKTSIVAVESNINYFPIYTAWGVEIDIDTWNFVWCDSVSSYYVTPFILTATPVVCIKGEFPNARYMSFFSYIGTDISKNGAKIFGQGINQDASNICNASINDKSDFNACQGLRDYEIEPDEDSKNPFIDPTYRDGDNKFFTIYLVSPYYRGKLPNSKNIIALSVYGAETAILLYRIYSPFNPKLCNSKYYWSSSYFDTLGCNENQKIINTKDGGASYPNLDKTNKICKNSDKDCIQQCVNSNLAHSTIDECKKYVGNNFYCICENVNDKCYQELNNIVKKCTNNLGDIDNICFEKPNTKVSACISNIDCSIFEDDNDVILCNKYVKNSYLQSCISENLLSSNNPNCYEYKIPHQNCNICNNKSSSCATDFNNIIKNCNEKYQEKFNEKSPLESDNPLNLYCVSKCNPTFEGTFSEYKYKYDPYYIFDKETISCKYDECQKFDCINGTCFPSKNGKYSSSNCDSQCYYKEYYVPNQDLSKCIFKSDPTKCDLNKNEYNDISLYGINSTPAYKLFRQGWIELPQVFIKYNYNNYFIKLNNWNFQKYEKISLLNYLLPIIDYYKKKGFGINNDIKEYYNNDENYYKRFNDNCKCNRDIKENYDLEIIKEIDDRLSKYYEKLSNINIDSFYKCIDDVIENFTIDKYKCNERTKQCEKSKLGTFVSKKECEKNCNKKATKYNCNNTTFKCEISETGYSTLLECKSNCKPLYKCNTDNYSCEKSVNGNFKNINECNDNCSYCDEIVDPNTYLYIGAQFPVGNYNKKDGLTPIINTEKPYSTYRIDPPYCNFFFNKCQCKNQETNQNNCCDYSLGKLDCKGNPCFSKWSSNKFKYEGIAQSFVYTASTGGVIPFPNPDASYIGCCTEYADDSIYVIWMDLPTFPHTPDYQEIMNKDKNLRYFSFGHYYWNMDKLNLRPVQSDLVDAQINSYPIEYIDEYTNEKITMQRAVIILSTREQYEYLNSYNIWNDNLNWLNWGKLPNVLDSSSTTINRSIKANNVSEKGIILYRQLFPSMEYKEAISNFYYTECIQTEIPVTDNIKQQNMINPDNYPKYCNPGPGVSNNDTIDPKTNKKANTNIPLCDLYGFNPCCLSRDLLLHMKNYYPRCEKIKLCNIEKEGILFWDRYLNLPLPYQYE